MVEYQLPKLVVAGSIPVARFWEPGSNQQQTIYSINKYWMKFVSSAVKSFLSKCFNQMF
jgi:hypothetical protein